MGFVSFIGIGLNDEKSMTLEGLEEARRAGRVFAEFYTNTMPNLDLTRLEQLVSKKIRVLDRTDLEDDEGKELILAARDTNVAFLVPGDPMVATTHVALRLSLSRNGIESRIVHAPSIMTAVCGATGLQSYKFGKAVTIPEDQPLPPSVLETISDNHGRGLHTLVLIDTKNGSKGQLAIPEAIARIIAADSGMGNRLAVGLARLGSRDERVKASRMRNLVKENFGTPPYSIIVPGRLHFMEAEALKAFCGAKDSDLREQN